MNDPAAFIRAQTALAAPALVPELSLWTATDLTPLWEATEELLRRVGIDPPFWAVSWPGSQALARYMLDHPESVAGRTVLDLGCGNGLAALAAAQIGARGIANDVDPLALVAVEMNAAANGLRVQTLAGDLTRAALELPAELILVGDLCYERGTAARLLDWLRARVREGRVVWLAEPGRAYAPREGFRELARYRVPTSADLEGQSERETVLLELSG